MSDIERIRQAYSSVDRARCAERFRRHVWSPRAPHRRIMRLYRCVVCKDECQTEFHHVDYTKPFCGAWLCTSCHRCVEAGSVTLHPRHIYDYTSLVRAQPHRWRTGQRGPHIAGKRKQERSYKRRKTKVPF